LSIYISKVTGISVRKFLLVLLTSLAAIGAQGGELTTADTQRDESLAPPSYAEAMVTIAPVPMPAVVVELARYSPHSTSVRQAKKVKAAKVARAKSMLSRSAREQIALANTAAKPDEKAQLNASDDEDDDIGLDDLDLHRSFSQPKVAKSPDQADDDDNAVIDLPEHVKLRLLLARAKAVDSYVLSQAGKAATPADEDIPDAVKLRLFIARARAVQAHIDKYGKV